jgi:hypothetical protein
VGVCLGEEGGVFKCGLRGASLSLGLCAMGVGWCYLKKS